MTSIIFKIVETLIWNVNAANTKQLSGPEKLTGLLTNRPQDIGSLRSKRFLARFV